MRKIHTIGRGHRRPHPPRLNIVFNRNIDPKSMVEFIERFWDLGHTTSEVP